MARSKKNSPVVNVTQVAAAVAQATGTDPVPTPDAVQVGGPTGKMVNLGQQDAAVFFAAEKVANARLAILFAVANAMLSVEADATRKELLNTFIRAQQAAILRGLATTAKELEGVNVAIGHMEAGVRDWAKYIPGYCGGGRIIADGKVKDVHEGIMARFRSTPTTYLSSGKSMIAAAVAKGRPGVESLRDSTSVYAAQAKLAPAYKIVAPDAVGQEAATAKDTTTDAQSDAQAERATKVDPLTIAQEAVKRMNPGALLVLIGNALSELSQRKRDAEETEIFERLQMAYTKPTTQHKAVAVA